MQLSGRKRGGKKRAARVAKAKVNKAFKKLVKDADNATKEPAPVRQHTSE